MSFILKICQTVAGIRRVCQFHDFENLILGGFLTFGPSVLRSSGCSLHYLLRFSVLAEYNIIVPVDFPEKLDIVEFSKQ